VSEPSQTSALNKRWNYGSWKVQNQWSPLHIADAEGCYIVDGSGKRYLDFSGQLICVSLGHKNEAVIRAIEAQARKLAYIAPSFATTVRAELSQLLSEVLPPGLKKFFFATSGTEANEAAIKIARLATGKSKIIARYRSYHGSTSGSIGLTGDPRRWPSEPSTRGRDILHAPETNCYACPIKHEYPSCDVACADYLEHMIESENDVAAVLVEPIVGTNGVLIPPPEYFPKLREICDRHDVLLIADEVMTGWGRTGKWFCVDHWGVQPDILVTAKGITSAYAPLGLCATNAKVAAYFDDHLFAHGHTYEAHPLTLAPAIATIHEMRRLNLVQRSREMGEYLGSKLRELKEKHPSIGDVRGMGLFWGVELVKSRQSRQPLNTKAEKMQNKVLVVDRVAAAMMSEGVYILPWMSHFVIGPPLIIEKSEIDFAVSVMDRALRIADEAVESSAASTAGSSHGGA
jgi:taurine--2-oxoglutarate transaminase